MKRTVIRTVSFFAALALTLAGTVMVRYNERQEYKRRLGDIYSSAVNTLCNSLSNINVELKKATYSTTAPMLSRTAAEIYRESGEAMLSLSQLPAGDGELEDLYKFISQAGDYALYLSRQSFTDEITEAERESLVSLSGSAERFAAEAEQMRIEYLQNGELDFSSSVQTPSTSGQPTEQEEDYPTLIYDGPYSDHIMTEESQLLASSEEITAQQALETAADALRIEPTELKMISETGGKLASYHFESEDASISVTKRGGYIVYFRKFHNVTEQLLSHEQAVDKAKIWLSQYTNMSFKTSYFVVDEGVCTVNFAYKEGATVCYSDLIKIGVALDSGEVVLCEANGYIMNHKPRTVKTPDKTLEEARAVISPSLSVKDSERVFIPTGGKKEIQCYEFLCEDADKNEVLVYINSDTLAEERIYLVVNISGGTLTK